MATRARRPTDPCCCRHARANAAGLGTVGRARTRPTPAHRRSLRRRSSGRISTPSCSSVSLATPRPPRGSEQVLRRRPTIFRLASSLPKRCSTPAISNRRQRAFEALRPSRAAVPAAELGLGRIDAAEGPARRRRRALPARGRALPRVRRCLLRARALVSRSRARTTTRSARSSSTRSTERAGRRSMIRCSPPSPLCATMPGRTCRTDVKLADTGDLDRRHRRARSGAGAGSHRWLRRT